MKCCVKLKYNKIVRSCDYKFKKSQTNCLLKKKLKENILHTHTQ